MDSFSIFNCNTWVNAAINVRNENVSEEIQINKSGYHLQSLRICGIIDVELTTPGSFHHESHNRLK